MDDARDEVRVAQMSPPRATSASASWRWWVCGMLLLASAINYMDRQTLANAAVRISTGSDGFLVRKLVRYAEPQTFYGFRTPGEAADWVDSDRASHRPGRKRKSN